MAFNGDADPNARLGVHVADLSAETPPNPFLFPRSLLHFHREGSFYPFLPAYPPAFLETQQPNPILESCAGKFFMSAAMGYAMGNLFGLVLGSYEGITPPVPLPGQRELPKVPWKESMVGAWRVTGGKMRYWGNNFLVISSMFSGLECAAEKARGRHDVGNELVAGCATGAALAAGQGVQAQCLGCVGFAAFSYAIHKFTDGRF
uniref:Mitochondrial import inner membrane translocase subunit TIM22 n=1 Tax=Globisporangium ultimum (strain ATCC 200006 / CBS 805.95 / DAOM BR144) TaxID=431595 RepID=K3WS24_GLOUD